MIKKFLDEEFGNILDDLKKISSVPSPPFKERQRALFLQGFLKENNYNSNIDKEGNLVAPKKGLTDGCIVWSAHIDTIFPEGTGISIKEKGGKIFCPGICDNSAGIVALLYLMKYLKKFKIREKHSNIFLFNVGEEGLGNLRGVRFFFDNLSSHVKAHICVEGHKIGRLTTRVVGSFRQKITVKSEGGHSWRDYGKPNAIVIASEIINQLSKIKFPEEPKTTLNIGTISGGKSVNSIPSYAEFAYEVRSLDKGCLKAAMQKANEMASSFRKFASIEMEELGKRPCGEMKDAELIRIVKNVHTELGIETIEDVGSTDSNYPISLGLPSVTVGITNGGNTHSEEEFLFIGQIKKGIEQLILLHKALNSDL